MTFDDLVTDYYPMLNRFLLGRTHHQQTAEDLTQETFLRALHAWPQFEDCYPKRWLFQIAVNLLRDRGRRYQSVQFTSLSQAQDDHHPELEDRLADDDSWGMPEEVVLRREDITEAATRVHGALAMLPVERAGFLLDFHCANATAIDVAARHGISYRAAKALAFRIRREMRTTLMQQAAG